jgi:hypothetical protein
MKRLALASALSDRAADNKVIVIDDWAFETPSTKAAKAALVALEATGRVLVVVQHDDNNAWLSFRNLPEVHVISLGELNTYDVLVSDVVIFTRDALPTRIATKIDRDIPSETASEPKPLVERQPRAKVESAPAAEPEVADEPQPEVVEDEVAADDIPADADQNDEEAES